MAYTGPDVTGLKDMVNAIVRRQLSPTTSLNTTLLELSLNTALRTIQDSYDRWRVLEQTVTAADDNTALHVSANNRLVPIPARYKDGARLYYLPGTKWTPGQLPPASGERRAIPMSVQGKPITMEWIWENHPDPGVSSKTPEAVAVQGENFVIVPTPAEAYFLSLDGRFYVKDLDSVNTRNWFTMHLTMPLVQLAVGHALELLHEEEWAQQYLALGHQGILERVGAEATEAARRAPVVVGQEPV